MARYALSTFLRTRRDSVSQRLRVWGERQMKHKILAGFLALSAIAAAPAALAQTTLAQTAPAPAAPGYTAPDYAAIVAAPDRSEADRKLDTNRAPAQWLAFIGAKPDMKSSTSSRYTGGKRSFWRAP